MITLQIKIKDTDSTVGTVTTMEIKTRKGKPISQGEIHLYAWMTQAISAACQAYLENSNAGRYIEGTMSDGTTAQVEALKKSMGINESA
jgi:hypothetical protein